MAEIHLDSVGIGAFGILLCLGVSYMYGRLNLCVGCLANILSPVMLLGIGLSAIGFGTWVGQIARSSCVGFLIGVMAFALTAMASGFTEAWGHDRWREAVNRVT